MNNRRTRNRKTREQRERAKMIIMNLIAGVSVAFGIWVFLSWMDIAFHNCTPNPTYQAWNLIDMILS